MPNPITETLPIQSHAIQENSAKPKSSLIERIKSVLIKIFFLIFPGAYRIFRETKKPQIDVAKQYKSLVWTPPTGQEDISIPKQRGYLILSLDGGGMRGVIPITILRKIEELLNGQIGNIFDCIAGTSTGAILAAGATKPDPKDPTKPKYKAKEVFELYENLGAEIFSRSIWHTVKTAGGLYGPKYDSAKKTDVLKKMLGSSTLADATTEDLLITSVDLDTDCPNTAITFSKKTNGQEKIADVANASSAAPTYFNAVEINGKKLGDGGILDNNPAFIAAQKALNRNDLEGRDIIVLSLGTGHYPAAPIRTEEGILGCVSGLIDVMLHNSDHVVERQLKELEQEDRIRYIRLQVELEDQQEAQMDNADPENLKKLAALAERTFDHFLKNGGQQSLIDLLQANRADNP